MPVEDLKLKELNWSYNEELKLKIMKEDEQKKDLSKMQNHSKRETSKKLESECKWDWNRYNNTTGSPVLGKHGRINSNILERVDWH